MKTKLHKCIIVLFALAISIFSGAKVFAAENLVTIYANSTVNYYDNNDCVWVENGYPGDSDYVRDFTIFGGDTKLVGGNGSAYATDRPKGNYPNAGSDYDDSNYYEPANEAPCFRINKVNNRTGFLTLKP